MNGITLRAKFYNKYVSKLTSAGVNYNMGNHFVNLVGGKNERLKKAFLDSKNAWFNKNGSDTLQQ